MTGAVWHPWADRPHCQYPSEEHHRAEETEGYHHERQGRALPGDDPQGHTHGHGRYADGNPGPQPPQRAPGGYDPARTDSGGERPQRGHEAAERFGVVM